MSKCGCNNNPCGCGTAISSQSICRQSAVAYIKAYNDDGCEVALTGSGTLISEGGQVYYTDGSLEQGQITIKPDNHNGVASILAESLGGKLVGIGKGAAEGSTLMFSGGQWVVEKISSARNVFATDSLKSGTRIAAFSCSNTGNVSLGYLDLTPSTYLYIDADGNYAPKTNIQLTEDILTVLCATTPAKLDTEEVASYFGCTTDGKVVKATTATTQFFLDPPARVYSQSKNNGAIFPPGTIDLIPSQGAVVPGSFVTNFVDVDLALQSGYNAKAKSCIMHVRAGIANEGINGGWDLVGVIASFERIRVCCAQANDVRKDHMECTIKVPEGASKVVRIEGIRQVFGGGPATNERSYLEVFLMAFNF